ncbi:formin-like protein 20 [Plectropomus leopardus]|uniref:formin-like protein 20 n=1 Tax=Plectropomus leopardus TaxID=160734 RepID=UPI001C4CE495|nr:formin-like protein 20 [Plectropomus leopardus]
MATWVSVSKLLIVALLSWNVLCFPANKGRSQHGLHEGSVPNMGAPPGLHYGTGASKGAPAQPSRVNHPAVSFLYDPEEEGVYASPGNYPESSSPTPDMSSEVPMEESTTDYIASRTSQPLPVIGLPAPPYFEAGELDHYEANMEHGNSEAETEELSFPPPPPPPVPPYPDFGYQAGELNHYASIYEHGNEERETEEQGFLPPPPPPPYAAKPEEEPAALAPEEAIEQPVAQLMPPKPNLRYLFLTGQFPPGTYTHYQSNYETGRDHWDEAHYEKYHYPDVQSPAIPQTQQDYSKI